MQSLPLYMYENQEKILNTFFINNYVVIPLSQYTSVNASAESATPVMAQNDSPETIEVYNL